jgi:hypothetical protein
LFLLNLIRLLPQFLADLETQNLAISRPWQDWKNLVFGTIKTIDARKVELGINQSADPLPLS